MGPTALGEIPEPSVTRLNRIGEWFERRGESIHGAGASPFRHPPWPVTARKDRLYVHLFRRPSGARIELPGLENRVRRAYVLGSPAAGALGIERVGADVHIDLTGVEPDPLDTVVALDLEDGPARIVRHVVRPGKRGAVILRAEDAEVSGEHLAYDPLKDGIVHWTSPDEGVAWDFEGFRPGALHGTRHPGLRGRHGRRFPDRGGPGRRFGAAGGVR